MWPGGLGGQVIARMTQVVDVQAGQTHGVHCLGAPDQLVEVAPSQGMAVGPAEDPGRVAGSYLCVQVDAGPLRDSGGQQVR